MAAPTAAAAADAAAAAAVLLAPAAEDAAETLWRRFLLPTATELKPAKENPGPAQLLRHIMQPYTSAAVTLGWMSQAYFSKSRQWNVNASDHIVLGAQGELFVRV